MTILRVGDDLFHVDRQTDRKTGGCKDGRVVEQT